MAYAVQTLVAFGTTFALQGGGHMPIAGSANIDASGVLISSADLDQLILSEDQSTVSVGPGNHWVDVYDYLEPSGKIIVGGRMGVVGVPGFLLGGGISFFSWEYGWSSANIASYEVSIEREPFLPFPFSSFQNRTDTLKNQCVLADGSIVNATSDNAYSDLFWALRGGGNSFAIVTNFELKTLDVPAVTVGQVAYNGSDLRDDFLAAVHGFAYNGSLDQKATITPQANWNPTGFGSDALEYAAMVFYSANDTAPAALANFTGEAAVADGGLPVSSSTFSYRSMSDWAAEVDTNFAEETHGVFFRFSVVSIVADLDAIGLVFDTFFAQVNELMANVTNGGATLVLMPITEAFLVNNRGGNESADPFGVDASGGPYIWLEEAYQYTSADDTDYIDEVILAVRAAIDAVLPEEVKSPFLYLNDADKDQPVFEGYAAENLERLKAIRAKYDPAGVYTTQMPGGWKVEDA